MSRIGKCIVISFALLVAISSAFPRGIDDAVRRGNEAFHDQQYKEALEQYQIAETESPESSELGYNIAGVLFQQGKYEEAVDRYSQALNTTAIDLEGMAQYNLGNTYYRMGDYPSAITRYENALRINPDDVDAKFNLELARKMLKEQIKPEQQQQQQQQQQNQEQEEEQEEEQNQDRQQQQQNEEQQQEQREQQKKQQREEEERMSREDAERILNALKDDEQDVQERIRREATGGDYQGRDW